MSALVGFGVGPKREGFGTHNSYSANERRPFVRSSVLFWFVLCFRKIYYKAVILLYIGRSDTLLTDPLLKACVREICEVVASGVRGLWCRLNTYQL